MFELSVHVRRIALVDSCRATRFVGAAGAVCCTGVVTLGLSWILFWLVWPASVIWALVYYGASFGGPHSATVGMRVMDLEMRTWSGEPGYFVLGAMHAVLFWVSLSIFTPLILLTGLFNGRRRLLHDMLLGTVIINTSILAPVAQPYRSY